MNIKNLTYNCGNSYNPNNFMGIPKSTRFLEVRYNNKFDSFKGLENTNLF